MRRNCEELRVCSCMGPQGAWTRWETSDRRLTWNDIWHLEPCRIQFLLRYVYDLLPTPTNLHRWGLTENPDCPLCGKPDTLEHVLSSCKTALTQGRFRWRHDQVLLELADVLERERARKRRPTKVNNINFVRPGENGKAAPQQGGIMDGAQL